MTYGRKSAKNALILFFLAIIIFSPLPVFSEVQSVSETSADISASDSAPAGDAPATAGTYQIESSAFKVIVGDAKYTASGAPVGTIFDGATSAGLAEIKAGGSMLYSTYQQRLQTYYSLISEQPYIIYTNRPVNAWFNSWLSRWGASVVPFP